ncbi:hypothetical protein CPAV1605_105 [seawater metagenome]|uniref:Uncharacterized protein n=1 Tax=seawater metagenome TaxID=1561972 RepID=A0A5E8CG11_9ZZZZ
MDRTLIQTNNIEIQKFTYDKETWDKNFKWTKQNL